MRKRFTADMDFPSERDMRAWLELVAEYAESFTMTDTEDEPKPRRNGRAKHHKIDFPKEMMVRITNKSAGKLPQQRRDILALLVSKYGNKPFRKGEGSKVVVAQFGHSASSVMTMLCRQGHLAAE